MKHRPPALAALLLFLILTFLPPGRFYESRSIESKCKVQVTGQVAGQQKEEKQVQVYLKNCTIQNGKTVYEAEGLLVYLKGAGDYPIGADLSLSGTIYPLEEPVNPGQFNSRLYYESQGITYTVYGENARITELHPAPVRQSIQNFKERLERVYDAVLDQPDSGILKAMVLGTKSDLSEELKLLYQKNGIAHVLAISGLHVSLLGMGLYKILKRCTGSCFLAGVPTVLLLGAYGFMTGASLSTVRAILMCCLSILADLIGRTYDMLSALGVSALILMIQNPLAARQSAFLLSFGAVLGIALISPVWKLYRFSARRMSQALCASLSVAALTLPVLLSSFFEYPLYSVFLNLLVIPLMSVLMTCGILCGLTGLIFLPAAGIFGIPCRLILNLYERCARGFLWLPGAVLPVGAPEQWKVLWYYGVLFACLCFLYRERRKQKYWHRKGDFHPSVRMASVCACAMLLSVFLLCIRVQTGFSVTMLDVGQGDGIFMRAPDGTVCLYDGGSSSVSGVGSYRIVPFLKSEGVRTLDYVFISHMDKDHISGIAELVEDGEIRIRHAVLPGLSHKDEAYLKMEDLFSAAGIPILYMNAGDRLLGDRFSFTCLWPLHETYLSDRNELSMALRLDYGDFQMIFTGDMGEQTEKMLAASGCLEEAEVLKVAHHGSRYSSAEAFLSQVRPVLSLISCSASNRYGHPGEETLTRLTEAGSRILITKDCGAIRVWTDGKKVRVRGYKGLRWAGSCN